MYSVFLTLQHQSKNKIKRTMFRQRFERKFEESLDTVFERIASEQGTIMRIFISTLLLFLNRPPAYQ